MTQNNAVQVYEAQSEGDLITLIDKSEERAILERAVQGASEKLVYSFKVGGKEINGISAYGAESLARWMAQHGEFIRGIDSQVQEFEDKWIVTVRVGRYALIDGLREQLLDVHFGTADQPKMEQVTKDGRLTWRQDGMAYRKAFSKAERNGILSCVPAVFQKQFIETIKTGKMIESSRPMKDAPAPKAVTGAKAGSVQPGLQIDPEKPWGEGPTDLLKNAHVSFGFQPAEVLEILALKNINQVQDPADAWDKLKERFGSGQKQDDTQTVA